MSKFVIAAILSLFSMFVQANPITDTASAAMEKTQSIIAQTHLKVMETMCGGYAEGKVTEVRNQYEAQIAALKAEVAAEQQKTTALQARVTQLEGETISARLNSIKESVKNFFADLMSKVEVNHAVTDPIRNIFAGK